MDFGGGTKKIAPNDGEPERHLRTNNLRLGARGQNTSRPHFTQRERETNSSASGGAAEEGRKSTGAIFRIYVTSSLHRHIKRFYYGEPDSAAISLPSQKTKSCRIATPPPRRPQRDGSGGGLILSRRAGFHLLSTLIKDSVDSVAGSRGKIAEGRGQKREMTGRSRPRSKSKMLAEKSVQDRTLNASSGEQGGGFVRKPSTSSLEIICVDHQVLQKRSPAGPD